ncbi:hypothetical protein AMV089 [Betaentomopoxvirus amoorei]|uniref:AMV089 n=1 Tax=Amsacta moorei entomopoxvirus TaxID=28321 RepID=Q9EMW0_AMEPV|nr:hypothetical protein AMV089 [Amsacta moorei entomopoxvirus]AAG02795.1 AMV089 [Amsacta moorei entomopoxvirus]
MKNIWRTYILLNFILINQSMTTATSDHNVSIDYSKFDFKSLLPIINNSTSVGMDKIFYSLIALCTVIFLIAMCVSFVTSLLIYYIYDNSKKKIIKSTMGIHTQV